MKNFIFKSDADFHKILFNKLDMILAENRHQRIDLSDMIVMLKLLLNSANLQKQVDEFFDKDNEDIPEDAETTAEQTQ